MASDAGGEVELGRSARRRPILRISLATLWLAATVGMIVSPAFDADVSERLRATGLAAGVAYMGLLIVWLAGRPPRAEALPELALKSLPPPAFRTMLRRLIAAAVLVFAIGFATGPWLAVVGMLTLAMIWFIVRHHDLVTLRHVVTAIGLAGVLLTVQAGTQGLDGYMAGYLISMAPLFLGGVLLLRHSGLSRSHIADGRWSAAGRSLLWGALLAMPAALLNASTGQLNDEDAWIADWWDPLAAIVPGFAEEIWARLVLTTLLYALLRPTSNERPNRAVWGALLLAAMIHAQAHSPTAALLSPVFLAQTLNAVAYGLPMGLLFIKGDLERAIGYHFLIDLIRFQAVYW